MDMAYILDTETTGLISNRLRKQIHQAEVIEYYGCLADLDNGEIVSEFETLIKPRSKVSEDIEKITNITEAMLHDKPSFEDVSLQIRSQIETAPMIIAHNASFDREILEIEFDRIGKKIAWPHMLCTIEQTMHMKGYRLGLTALHETLFNEKFTEAHRAKNDVKALLRCCVELRRQGAI